MKKVLKILAVLGLLVVVLLVGASVALHFLLPPEKAKALVLKQLSTHLKREVTAGKVSVGLISGLSVSDLKISEAPTFAQGVFVSSQRFSVRLALWPLLFKRIEVQELVLDHPKINVVRLADGKTYNFSDLMAPAVQESSLRGSVATAAISSLPQAEIATSALLGAPQGKPPRNDTVDFQLHVSQAQIQKGTVQFTDRSPAKQSLTIDPLDLKLKNVSLTSPFSVQAYLKTKAKGLLAELKLAGDADLASGSFKINECELASGGSVIALSGKASQLKSDRPSIDLNLDIKELKLASFATLLALPPALRIQEPIRGTAKLKGDEQKMDFTLKAALRSLELKSHGKVTALKSPQPQINLHVETTPFTLSDILPLTGAALPQGVSAQGKAQLSADVAGTLTSSRVAAKFDVTDSQIVYGDKFSKPAGTPLRLAVVGEIVQPTQSANFQNVNATAGPVVLNGAISLKTVGKTQKLDANFKSNTFSLQELARLVPMLSPYKLNGQAALDLRSTGNTAALQNKGSLTLKNVSLQYEQSTLSQIATQVSFSDQDLSIPKLTGKLNGSDISLKMTGRQMSTHPRLTTEGSIAELDLDKLMPPPAAAPVSRGFVAVAWAAASAAALPIDVSGRSTIGKIKSNFYNAQDLDLKWDLKNFTPDLGRASGTAVLKQGPGVLQELEKMAATYPSAKAALMPILVVQGLQKKGLLKSLGVPSLERIPFQGIHGDYLLGSGMLNIKTFDITGQDLSINTLGSIGLIGEQPLDVKVTMRLAQGALRGTLGQIMTDESGRAKLVFTAKGTVAAPEVKVDLQEAGKKALDQLGKELFKKFGKPQQPAQPAPTEAAPAGETPPADSQPAAPALESKPDPGKELENALKNIFKKK